MTKPRFFEKATKNLEAADLLLAAGLFEPACNRSYYAMHDAARCALVAIGQDRAALSKTHSGLLGVFGLHLVKSGILSSKWSTMIAQEERARLLADYDEGAITEDDARKATENAEAFVAAIAEPLDKLS